MMASGGLIDLLKRLFSVLTGLFLIGGQPASPAPDAHLQSFYFQYSTSYLPMISGLDAKKTEDVWVATVLGGWGDEERAFPLTEDEANALEALVIEQGLLLWAGFNKTDSSILDGEMFSFSAAFSDGTSISAHGSNAFPDHYHITKDAIFSLIETFLQARSLLPTEE